MWATKTDNIKEDIGEINTKIDAAVQEKVELDHFSFKGTELDIRQSNSKTKAETELGSFHTIRQ